MTHSQPRPVRRNIVIGQRVDPDKLRRAKDLRKRMTPEERIVWQQVRANRVRGLQFRTQQIIDGFIVDFYCHAAGLIVEVDGEIHQRQAEYDRERDEKLIATGLRILRVSNDEVRNNLPGVLARIAQLIDESFAAPTAPEHID